MDLEPSSKLRRAKSREVSSRFQCSHSVDQIGNRSPIQTLSPVRRKPNKNRLDDPSSAGSLSLRGIWPSSSSPSFPSMLGDLLGQDRLDDILERTNNAKENHRPIIIGGSMRHNNKHFSLTSSDENSAALFPKQSSRRASDGAAFADLGAACSSAYSRAKNGIGGGGGGVEVASKYMNGVTRQHRRSSDANSGERSPAMIKRVNSLTLSQGNYGSSRTQWAMSPGRSRSSSFSCLKPTVTSKGSSNSVEKLFSMGLDFFKTKKSSSSSSSSSCSSMPVSVDSVSVASETGHEIRILHNRLMQWRFVNARAHCANANVANRVECYFVFAGDSIAKLRHSVVQKKMQLQKGKLEMKLNFILQSQFKLLEGWGGMERQHLAAVSKTKESLHSVVCKVPLIEGAKVDIQSARNLVRQASDLASSIESMLTTFSPTAEKNADQMSELAKVVAQEKLLIEECHELLRSVTILEIEESSLKCDIIQSGGFGKRKKH